MPGNNKIVPFASGASANVESTSAWLQDPVANVGFQSGLTSSKQFNKAFKQSSAMASCLAQFMADNQPSDVSDDLSTSALEAILYNAIVNYVGTNIQNDTWKFGVASGTNVYALSLTPSQNAFIQGAEVRVFFTNTNTSTTCTMNVNSQGNINITKSNGQQPLAGDLSGYMTLVWTGANWMVKGYCLSDYIQIVFQYTRRVLSAALTLYVRTDGSDTNNVVMTSNGLTASTNTASGAFQTLQAAWNFVGRTYDVAGQTINIIIGLAGIYVGININNTGIFGNINLYSIVSGVVLTPLTFYTGVTPACIRCEVVGLTFYNVTLDVSSVTAGNGVVAIWAANGQITIGASVTLQCTINNSAAGMIYGGGGGARIFLSPGVTLTITGGSSVHTVAGWIGLDGGASCNGTATGTATIAITNLNFSQGVYGDGGTSQWNTITINANGCTGKRFYCGIFSTIKVYGQGVNYFPGDTAGNYALNSDNVKLGYYA